MILKQQTMFPEELEPIITDSQVLIPQLSGIYAITNRMNGRVYYGSSVNMQLRKQQHWTQLRRHIHVNRHLQRAWNKYGESSFLFSVVEFVDVTKLLEAEQRYIDLNTNGYNLAPTAGSSLGSKRSPEAVQRMSKAQRRRSARMITIGDRTQCLAAWCEERGISPSAVLQRVNKLGWTFEEALSEPTLKTLTYNGLTLTIRQWSKRTGFQVMTINQRLWNGWSVERTLTEKPKYTKRMLTHNGRTQSIRAWEKETGFQYHCIIGRITDLGWSVADALTIPPQLKTRKAK